jgi:hypothetical protein
MTDSVVIRLWSIRKKENSDSRSQNFVNIDRKEMEIKNAVQKMDLLYSVLFFPSLIIPYFIFFVSVLFYSTFIVLTFPPPPTSFTSL